MALPIAFDENVAEEISVSPHGRLLQQFLKDFPPNSSLTDIYNWWLFERLPEQISSRTLQIDNVTVRFGPVFIIPPFETVLGVTGPKTPNSARLHKTSYNCTIQAHIKMYRDVTDPDDPCSGTLIDETTIPQDIGRIPCMVHSKACTLYNRTESELLAMQEEPRDPGGYFIIDGLQRFTFMGEMLRLNKFLVNTANDTGEKFCHITADTIRGTVITNIRMKNHKGKNTIPTQTASLTFYNLRQSSSGEKKVPFAMNIFSVIRLYVELKREYLGATREEQDYTIEFFSDPYNVRTVILKFVKKENRNKVINEMSDTIRDYLIKAYKTTPMEVMRDMVRGARKDMSEDSLLESVLHTMESSILSHEDPYKPMFKVYTLCMMTAILLEYSAGIRPVTDRDSWSNKRLSTSAKSCEQLFRGLWKKFIRDTEKKLLTISKKNLKLSSVTGEAKKDVITKGFHSSFTGPTWGVETVNVKSNSPVVILMYKAFTEMFSFLSRVDADIDRKSKSWKVRAVQPSQWGYIDPGDTPENSAVGITKAKAITAHVTVVRPYDDILDILMGEVGVVINDKEYRNVYLSENPPEEGDASTVLLINGMFKGWCDGRTVKYVLTAARRGGMIDRRTCIVLDMNNYLYIHTDEGRLVRPLLIVDDVFSDVSISSTYPHLGESTLDKIQQVIEDEAPLLVIERKGLWGEVDQVMEPSTPGVAVYTRNMETLFDEGCLEWIDAWEQEYSRVAALPESLEQWRDDIRAARERYIAAEVSLADSSIDKKTAMAFLAKAAQDINFLLKNRFTHCEVHPQAMYGVSLALMTLIGFNQAPRATYQSQMGKQALGTYHVNHANRFDNDAKVFHRATRPLVTQQLEEEMGLKKLPSGFTAQLAILNIYGDTQEDAFYIKEDVVNFGYMSLSHYFVIETTIKANMGEALIRPPPRKGEDPKRYQFLTAEGLPMINAPLNSGDFVIGKTYKSKETGEIKNISIPLKVGEYGIVDKVFVSDRNANIRIQIKIRRDRHHRVSDKLSSRYAQKGTTSRIVPRTQLPFDEETGEIPDMVVNTHCVTGDTLVSMSDGTCRRIDSFVGGEKVWCFSPEGKGFNNQRCLEYIPQGERDIIRVTLEDGRVLRCTPEHKIMTYSLETKDYKFIEAVKLPLDGSIRMVSTYQGPHNDPSLDPLDMILDFSERHTLPMCEDLTTREGQRKGMAVCRLLGCLYTDGCFSSTKQGEGHNIAQCSVAHKFDAEQVLDDIELLTGKRPAAVEHTAELYGTDRRSINIRLPTDLGIAMCDIPGVPHGRKTQQGVTWPKFILDPTCPKFLLREFLGAVFGGDGWAPYMINKKTGAINLSGVAISQTTFDHVEELCTKFEQLVSLLDSLGVPAVLDGIKEKSEGGRVRKIATLRINPGIEFGDNVGFRYCIGKNTRLCAAQSYWRYLSEVKRQHLWVIERANVHFEANGKKGLEKALNMAKEDLKNAEPVLNEYYSLPNLGVYQNRRRKARTEALRKLDYKHIEDAKTYLARLGCLSWFDERQYGIKLEDGFSISLHISPVDVRKAGKETVYDIAVGVDHTFTAWGLGISNSIPKRMTMGYVLEALFGIGSAISGQKYNATHFNKINTDDVYRLLELHGMRSQGYRQMVDPVTGIAHRGLVFGGPVYIQILHHLGPEKIQVRSTGVLKLQTHQPPRDAVYGGRRVGEMERNAILSHGATNFMYERFVTMSDGYPAAFCKVCGNFAVVKPDSRVIECGSCGPEARFVSVTIPYVYKLLVQLMFGAGLYIKLDFTDVKDVTRPSGENLSDDEDSLTEIFGEGLGIGEVDGDADGDAEGPDADPLVDKGGEFTNAEGIVQNELGGGRSDEEDDGGFYATGDDYEEYYSDNE